MDTVSIYIINYNGGKVLGETIDSLKNQDYPSKNIALIDDCSSDNSVAFVQKNYPDVEITGLSYNSGYPNKLRKLAIQLSKTRYVFIVDNDIVFAKDCLSNLLHTIKSGPDIGLCTPRLMYYSDRNKIYVCWTSFHYLCTSISPLRDTYTIAENAPVDTLGGGTMLLDKEKLDIIGTIDDSYPMGWGEDAEIYARMKIAGMRSVYVPNAVGYHHAKEFITERKPRAFGQVRNRWFMILSMYQIKTIFILFPALLIYECVSFLMLVPKRLAGVYFQGMLDVIRSFKTILIKRISIQKTRKVKDGHLLTKGPIHVPQAYLTNKLYKTGINFLNKFFDFYWETVKRIL